MRGKVRPVGYKPPLRSLYYQWESLLYQPEEQLSKTHIPKKKFGPVVVKRQEGKATRVRCNIYYPEAKGDLYLVGSWNAWGETVTAADKLSEEEHWYSVETEQLKHQDAYLFLLITPTGKEFLRDPASTYFDKNGNSVFWDFADPTCYQAKHEAPNTLHRPTIILQTDPVGLVAKWFAYDTTQKTLAESDMDLFTYIRTCGVLDMVKEMGYNTLQFLPVAQSIDGDNWKFRYLVAYPFAIHKNWGTPDSFLQLVDACHARDIALIGDLIVSHCPYKDFFLCGQPGEEVGLHKWKEKNGREVFLEEETPWGTMRFNYGNEHIRTYLVESALHFLKHYKLDGFRIDNVDGILRYGDHGQGPDRPHGRQFLRELHQAIYDAKPMALIHLESHYFYGDNAKMLVAPLSSDPRALGATAYNSSRLTYYFHKEFMPKSVEQISVWRFEHIREEKEWGRSNATIADFHNHDAAAGLMAERATGSYAYDALILKRPELAFHAQGKIKVMEAIIAFACEGRLLDLAQSFLLQLGTFEHDSSIHWNLLNEKASKEMTNYKKQVNELLQKHPAFWPENTLYRNYANVDEQSKVLVIKRVDKTQGTKEQIYTVINLSSKHFNEYAVGIEKPFAGNIILDSTTPGKTPEATIEGKQSNRFEVYPFEWQLALQPYHVLMIKVKE